MAAREEIEVMDTPDRCKNNQIASNARKFEDSPVYSFLNQLSPLKPVKSSQTVNHLAFVSLPSVFTSPHVTSLRDCRSLQRFQLPDPSKPEFSSDNVDEADKSRTHLEVTKKVEEPKDNRNPCASNGETTSQFSKVVTEHAENLSYDCKSPSSNLRPNSALLLDASKRKENLRGVSQVDQSNNSPSCDWESLISDVFTFESPNVTDSYKKAVDHGPSFYNSFQNELPNTKGQLFSNDRSDVENLSTQPGEGSEMMENEEIQDMDNPTEKTNLEEIGFYRGMRRRCLVFEMAEARRKQLDQNSCSDSPALLQSNEQLLVAMGNEASRCVLPGIGLHLNTLATTPKNYKIVGYESTAHGRFLGGPTSSSVNIQPSTTSQEQLNDTLALASSEREFEATEYGVFPVEDAYGVNENIVNEDLNQSSSPKKKRRRPELGVERESCKRCNCKKSKCLKLYCECFAAGVYCVEPCACIDCFNKPIHEETVLATRKQIESRNPLAFAPKVIRNADSVIETGDDSSKTPASARHKRGCNCKKSGCLKKYCECYQGGVGCSINCRCEGCKNAFGRKDGSCMMAMEVEIEEGEAELTEKNIVEKNLKKPVIQNEHQQNMDSASLATPLRAVRQSASKNKPPRSSFTSIGGSSSSFLASQVYDKPSFFQPSQKFEKRFETVWEEEIPEFLQGDSPISGVKSSSPNQKRVSSPHTAGMSPGLLRSSRKLILQSISSFPSLGSTQ